MQKTAAHSNLMVTLQAMSDRNSREKIIARMERVIMREPNTGCWLWSGAHYPNDYGLLKYEGRYQLAHRVSYMLHVGPIPDGMLIRHKCDVKACVNPDHLVPGTKSENARDAVERGQWRAPRGARARSTRLTESQVIEIRQLRAEGVPYRALMRRFDVSYGTLHAAANGRSWAWLEAS